MTTPTIFIAHSSADRDWARAFAKSMLDLGASIWFDEFNIKPGDSISELIETGLRKSAIVVLLVTNDSLRNHNFFFELGAALGMNKKIIPIVPKDFEVSSLPLSIQLRKYLIRKSPEETARELAEGLELLHGEAA